MNLLKSRLTSLPILLFSTLLSIPCAYAQIVDPQNVLIKNVQLLDGGAETEGIQVNILIKDNILELITKDEVPIVEAAMAVDARNGFLFGKLEVGETPSFIILNQDPRENFEILLDTNFFTIFAISDGKLFRNNLFEVKESVVEKKDGPRRSGWLAYTPPPTALPTSYDVGTKWNTWDTKYISGLFISAVVLDRTEWPSQDAASIPQVGDLGNFEGGEIRGFRFGAAGTINFTRPWVYSIGGATHEFDKGFNSNASDTFTFFDYRLDIPFTDTIYLSVGKQKEPISMERIMTLVQSPMQERAAVSDAMLPSRNFGVVLSGSLFDQRVTWAGGAFNDWLDSGGSFSDNSSQVVGRVTWLPMLSEDESNLIHLGLSARYSNAKEGVQFSTTPEIDNAPAFVDTGPIVADSITSVNVEATWRKGPYWLAAEYVDTDIDAPLSGSPSFSGYHITGSWILTGEMRPYNRKSGTLGSVPVARSAYQGGKGAWEVGVRYSNLDLTDGLIDGGEMDILSLGVNWWLTPVFNVNLNYRHTTTDRRGLSGEADGFVWRALLMLE